MEPPLNAPAQSPLPRNPLRRLCLLILSAFGWSTIYVPFPEPRGVLVVYPHTSNWDFVIGMLYRLGRGVPVHWLGAIRSIADEFERRDFMWIGLAPEGTRSHTDHWKSGFYQIALAAKVSCGLGFIDYPTKTLGITAYIQFTGDVEEDLAKIRAFYADKRGLRPGQASDIQLRIPQPPPGDGAQSPDLPNRDSS